MTAAVAIVIEQTDPQGHVAAALLRQAAVEARGLYPELHPPGAPWPTNPPTPERGVYLVGFVDDRPVACGALRPLDARTGELKRMFVLAGYRRQGFASAMLAALEAHAHGFAYERLRLETGNRQPAAIALYEARGFRRIPSYAEHADDPTSVCFEKRLGGVEPPSGWDTPPGAP